MNSEVFRGPPHTKHETHNMEDHHYDEENKVKLTSYSKTTCGRKRQARHANTQRHQPSHSPRTDHAIFTVAGQNMGPMARDHNTAHRVRLLHDVCCVEQDTL